MVKYQVEVRLEKPTKPYMVMRKYFFDVPNNLFEGYKDRDVYLYAKVSRVDGNLKREMI